MKKFNFEDGIFELDSLLLCNISVPSATAGAPATVQDPETDSTVNGADKTKKADGGDTVPAADDTKNKEDPNKTTLQKPTKPITPKNTQDLFAQIGKVDTAVTSITELLMAIIKMNRDRKDMEVKMMWAECQNICNNIQSQAENMRADAKRALIMGICCSCVSIAAGGLSMFSAGRSLKQLNSISSELKAGTMDKNAFDLAKDAVDNKSKWWNGFTEVVKGIGQLGGNVNEYLSKLTEAENKDIDAQTEVLRTAMEEIKKALDDARNAITSCQSNVNELFQSNRQTLNKVMG